MLKTNLQATALESPSASEILCFYLNNTNHLQILKSRDPVLWGFEKIVFPGQRLLFKGLPKAQLEIHTCAAENLFCPDIIFCKELRVSEN